MCRSFRSQCLGVKLLFSTYVWQRLRPPRAKWWRASLQRPDVLPVWIVKWEWCLRSERQAVCSQMHLLHIWAINIGEGNKYSAERLTCCTHIKQWRHRGIVAGLYDSPVGNLDLGIATSSAGVIDACWKIFSKPMTACDHRMRKSCDVPFVIKTLRKPMNAGQHDSLIPMVIPHRALAKKNR